MITDFDPAHDETGTFYRNRTVLAAIVSQHHVLDDRYSAWRVERAYLLVQARLRGHAPIVADHVDEITEMPAGCTDAELEQAALALQARGASDPIVQQEAAEMLIGDLGEDEGRAVIDAQHAVSEVRLAALMGGLARKVIQPLAHLAPPLAGKLQ